MKIVTNTGRHFDSNLGYHVSCAQLYKRCKESQSSHVHILITIPQLLYEYNYDKTRQVFDKCKFLITYSFSEGCFN